MGERQSDSRSEGIVLADEAQGSTADALIISNLRKEPLSEPKA